MTKNVLFFNINHGHFKVWCYEQSGSSITTYRGMVGKPIKTLRPIKKTFRQEEDAYKYISMKVKEKMNRKGYSAIPRSKYEKSLNKPLSYLLKVLEKHK